MARLVKATTSDDTNYFDTAVNGMNVGLGIASHMRERDLQKLQTDQYNREAGEWDANAGLREKEREAALAKAAFDGLDTNAKMNTLVGTGLSSLSEHVHYNKDGYSLDDLGKQTSARVDQLSGGKVKFTYEPVTLEDGSTGYKGKFSGGYGLDKEIQFKSNNELAAHLDGTRRMLGLNTGQEVLAHTARKNAANFAEQLGPEGLKRYGATQEEAMANPQFQADAIDAFMSQQTGGQYAEAQRERDRNADDQRMQTDKHNQDMDAGRLSMEATRANIAYTKQARDEASARFENWKKNVPLENQKALNELNRGTVEYGNTVLDSVKSMTAPDIEERDEFGQATGKMTYSQNAMNEMQAIARLVTSADAKTSPLDAIHAAMVASAEAKAKLIAEEKAKATAEAKAIEDAKNKPAPGARPPRRREEEPRVGATRKPSVADINPAFANPVPTTKQLADNTAETAGTRKAIGGVLNPHAEAEAKRKAMTDRMVR